MIKIVITPEDFSFSNEVEVIKGLLITSTLIHIRKKGVERKEIEQFLSEFSSEERKKMVLHEHIDLAEKLGLGGIHLTSKQSKEDVPNSWKGTISQSCHSVEEVIESKLDYVFLSPIFDSISKEGYKANFSEEELIEVNQNKQTKVIALGGITEDKISTVESLGFDGYAMLGGFWNREIER